MASSDTSRDIEWPRGEDRGFLVGVHTFGDVTNGPDGVRLSHAASIRDIVEQAEVADQVGLDYFGIGEHHIDEMPVSAGDLILAAAAERTSRIHLGSAVTVLSSDDPVRVFQRYATLDALSNGRAEVILGRGSSTESFPLYGYDLAEYEELFEQKVELFAQLRDEKPVEWPGGLRPAMHGLSVYPHTERGALPTWIGVGGSPNSAIRAARYGFPLMLAIIGGNPARFASLAELFRRATEQFGYAPRPIGIHSIGHIAETDEEAQEEFWHHYSTFLPEAFASRGFPAITRQYFDREVGPHGALYVGSPTTVAAKIVKNMRILGAQRFDFKYGMGPLPHASILKAIRLLGEEVAPVVRELLTQEPVHA
jgi:probable LLM family oxidoreductase